MNRRWLVGGAFLAVFALVVEMPAQVTGRLFGTVLDQSGSAVPGATVSVFLPGGDTPLLSVVTSTEGFFNFSSVRPEFYDLAVEAAGFRKQVIRGIKVDPARETAVPPIRLELPSVTEVVEVIADTQNVQASNAEVSTTITNAQIRQLPLLDRSPLELITTQAGVSLGRGSTVINGQRTSYSNVTLDGINIQDNFIRSNALDFLPNLLLLDQVAEVTISTSNASSTVSGGASHVSFVTPSGTNQYRGTLYWYNRNSVFAANTWFNNRDGIPKPFLNQNQIGGTIGGPIIKDRLLFYGNYEAFRLRRQSTADTVILTGDARRGIYTYPDLQGGVRKVDILQAARVSIDPAIQQMLSSVPGSEKINNFRIGDSSESLLRNTAGYSFLVRDNRTRDNATVKLDYNASTKHVFSGSYVWNRDIVDRPDLSDDYSVIPKVYNDDAPKLLSAGWRWSPSATFTNEFRGGFNLAPGIFKTKEQFGSSIITGTVFSNPLNTFRSQGRFTDTYNYMDHASYWRGKHHLQFGSQFQQIRVEPYNEGGITPTYGLGIGSGNPGLTAAQLPGVGATDFAAANNLLATLAGYITSYFQTFNITNRTSGFVSGAANRRNLSLDQYGFYAQDNWKMTPRLTATLGLRYDYFSVADERDALVLLPRIVNNDPITTLLSNSTLDFAGSAVSRPWYKKDRNNFAPNIGLAYDVFGNGKTALRAGFSISYVNDETIRALDNNVLTNSGLSAIASRSGLSGRISTGLPPIPTPRYKVPRTFEDNYDLDSQTAFGLPDPNLATPYVQEWNFGIQHEIKGTIIDARYAGNHATKAFRAFDFNQVVIRENGFLEDFLRALNNGNLARASTGVFDPRFNSSIPGSQGLTVFPRLVSGGLLTNATIRSLIETGQAGELAALYQIVGFNGSVDFFRNPFALGTNMVTNYSNSTYNALQIDATRRMRSDLQFQANYTYSKVLGDAAGVSQARFEAFLDSANAKIERARAPFDITHAIKANTVYDLPAGEGHRFNVRGLGRVLTGWSASGILIWQSGTPFSVFSGRGTLNRISNGRSSMNTADTTLTKSQLDELFRFRQTSTGPYFVAASAIGGDGRAVAPDGKAPFNGQVFFHPGPGRVGGLQRRMFSGPWTFNLDFALMKKTTLKENHSIEFRMEAANIFNHPTWFVGDQAISSTNFGKVANTFYDRRLIQFSLHYRF